MAVIVKKKEEVFIPHKNVKYLNKFEKSALGFFKYSDCIQLRLFQGLGRLNEAEGKVWAKKRDGERMEDECVEVCDDSVRNDKETERETAGFTAPRPTCLDLWI